MKRFEDLSFYYKHVGASTFADVNAIKQQNLVKKIIEIRSQKQDNMFFQICKNKYECVAEYVVHEFIS